VFVNNFYATSFQASGGTALYSWSGNVPAGVMLRASGLLLGTPTAIGTSTFAVTVRDAIYAACGKSF
jgi:putative Ig domain-containing protein